MVVTPEIWEVVAFPFSPDAKGERLGEFRNWLDAFSEGGELSVAEDPHLKPQDAMLARVDPVDAEFWSIRVTDPEQTPGIRSLGAFADKDTFVALTWDYRELIGEFDDEVATAHAAWVDLFGAEVPHSGDHIDDYLTNYYSV